MRLFAAIIPPPHVLDHLAVALDSVLARASVPQRSLQPTDNWHLTCAFYGDMADAAVTSIEADLAFAASQTGPLDLALAGAGCFRNQVAWIGVADVDGHLNDLMHRLSQAGVTDRVRNRGHLTLSRQARGPAWQAALAALAIYRGPSWQPDRLVLMRSDLGQGRSGHSRYTTLAEVDLPTQPA